MEINIRNNDQLVTLEIPEGDFTQMIQRDQQERAAAKGHPVEPRTPQEIMDDLNRADYNGWHQHNRQDRQTSNISLEAYNEHGNQADIATFGAATTTPSTSTAMANGKWSRSTQTKVSPAPQPLSVKVFSG